MCYTWKHTPRWKIHFHSLFRLFILFDSLCDWTQMMSECVTLWPDLIGDCFLIARCWFGKRAGVYTDYIYQGPMILVLLVRTPPNRAGLHWTELVWTVLDWSWLVWSGLDWSGLVWTSLDWILLLMRWRQIVPRLSTYFWPYDINMHDESVVFVLIGRIDSLTSREKENGSNSFRSSSCFFKKLQDFHAFIFCLCWRRVFESWMKSTSDLWAFTYKHQV